MDNNLKWIEIDDKKYPLLFSMNVMESIQNKYGSLDKWSNIIQPKDGSEANIGAVIDTFYFIINEGIDFVNFEDNLKEPLLDRKTIGRLISKVGLKNATKEVTDLVIDSTKDDNPKNE